MDGAQWLKILLKDKNLVGSSWDGEHLKNSDLRRSYTLSAGADRILSMKCTILYLFCLIFINV